MKKKLYIVTGALMLILCQSVLVAQPKTPKLTNRTKSGILSYLNTITRDSMIIVGQYCGVGSKTAEGYDEYFEGLYKLTGKYPALISVEYGYTPNNNLPLINHYAIKHWNKGGLVTISWCADNPWVDGYNCMWKSIDNKAKINLNILLKNAPESKAKTAYREELLNVGHALKQLQDSGVMVLWRPFHEMNGPWFWWCVNDLKTPTNVKDFERLWKDMYETFTNDLGLKNLIWVYGANADGAEGNGKWTASVGTMFPGSRYVDIVGTDIYMNVPEFEDFEALKKLDKPIVVSEFGPAEESYGKFDEREIIKTFRGKAGWFLQWSSWKNAKVAIKDNMYYDEMMNDPSAITLDKLQ